jgi:serine/threonine protein kinase
MKDSNILEEESLVLSYISSPRIPKVKLFGYSGQYMVLVMELLGPSLDSIIKKLPDKKMSIRCVCNIAYQLISILETIHNNNIIHRDIKPANINLGVGNMEKFLFLIDFGLSRKYRSSTTKKHYPFEQTKKLVGNARYSSINALEGGTQSRRDDLESLGYMLIYLCLGRLPWQGLLSNSKEDKYYRIREVKKKVTPSELCETLPNEFEQYIKYTRNLKYEEDPDYNYLKNLFVNVLKKNNWEFNYYYDWDQTTLSNEEVISINNSLSSYTNTNIERKIPKLYTKINELKNERKLFGENFEVERFVFDIEEESNFNIMQRNQNNKENENDIEIYNYSNSMAPFPKFKKYKKPTGCLPCQPKAYKEEDDSCCLIF